MSCFEATRNVVFAALIASGGTLAHANGTDGSHNGGGAFVPLGFVIDTAGNSVVEPDETVVLAPTWMNGFINPNSLAGLTSNFTGPAGPLYTNADNAADYGVLGMFSSGSCTATGNCYTVRVSAATRPATHWDSTIQESVNGVPPAAWTIHIGASFSDIPVASPFYRFVETILHRNVTSGCGGGAYCAAASTSREQMAVFVLVAKEPPAISRPPAGPPRCSPTCPSRARSAPGSRISRAEASPRAARPDSTARPPRSPATRWRSSSSARWILL